MHVIVYFHILIMVLKVLLLFSVANFKVIQRRAPQRAADDTQGHWVADDGSHFASQV